ncbi:MAG: hypothetical protein IPJ34_26380 [Myxococcales bacterium]|nr:hypothetical protein [Myxococcales bacterium]
MRWWFALVLALPGCLPDFGARMQALTPRPWVPTLCTDCRPHRPVAEVASKSEAPWQGPTIASTTHWLGEPLEGMNPFILPDEPSLHGLIFTQVHAALFDLEPEYRAVWARVEASTGAVAVEAAKPSLEALGPLYATYLDSLAPSAVLDPVETWADVETLRATEFTKLRPRAAERALLAAEVSLDGWCKTRVAERLPSIYQGFKDVTFLVERVFTKQLAEGIRKDLVRTLPAALVDDVTTRARARVLAATRKVKPKPTP